jgi:hypothetical protein
MSNPSAASGQHHPALSLDRTLSRLHGDGHNDGCNPEKTAPARKVPAAVIVLVLIGQYLH